MPIASVDEFWDKFEAWYGEISRQLGENNPYGPLLAGASEAEIEAVEEEFGFPLPNDLRAFYRKHDGTPFWNYAEGFSTLNNALAQAKMRRRIEQDNRTQDEDEAGFVWWRESYFPVVEDGAGNADVVQCDSENAGLMVNFDHEVGSRPTGETFLQFLQAGLDSLGFYLVDDGELLGLDELPEDHPNYFDGDLDDWLAQQKESQA